jgi:hypothetical protein
MTRTVAWQVDPVKAAKRQRSKAGLFSALRRAVNELSVSLQNVLAFAATFAIPFVVTVLGAPLSVALAAGLCLVIWFFVAKTIKYVKSRTTLVLSGTACTAVVMITAFVISALLKPTPKPNSFVIAPQTPQSSQHYETHGSQSPIMPDNKGAVTISNQGPGAVTQKEPKHK